MSTYMLQSHLEMAIGIRQSTIQRKKGPGNWEMLVRHSNSCQNLTRILGADSAQKK
jgi:hypothetical protein